MSKWQQDLEENFGALSTIFILETNVDDIRGELIGNLIEQVMEAGALDISILATITKKNRPGYLLRVLCKEADISRLTKLLIYETGSLGVRIREEKRICLERKVVTKSVEIANQRFDIHIKQSFNNSGKLIRQKIEFIDLKRIASSLNRPIHQIEQDLYSQISLKFD